jgi:ferredoxin
VAPAELLQDATRVRQRFAVGATLFGAWVGLVFSVKLISLSLYRRRADFEPDPGGCFGCARCFESCPNERMRRGWEVPEPAAALTAAVLPENKPLVAPSK